VSFETTRLSLFEMTEADLAFLFVLRSATPRALVRLGLIARFGELTVVEGSEVRFSPFFFEKYHLFLLLPSPEELIRPTPADTLVHLPLIQVTPSERKDSEIYFLSLNPDFPLEKIGRKRWDALVASESSKNTNPTCRIDTDLSYSTSNQSTVHQQSPNRSGRRTRLFFQTSSSVRSTFFILFPLSRPNFSLLPSELTLPFPTSLPSPTSLSNFPRRDDPSSLSGLLPHPPTPPNHASPNSQDEASEDHRDQSYFDEALRGRQRASDGVGGRPEGGERLGS